VTGIFDEIIVLLAHEGSNHLFLNMVL